MGYDNKKKESTIESIKFMTYLTIIKKDIFSLLSSFLLRSLPSVFKKIEPKRRLTPNNNWFNAMGQWTGKLMNDNENIHDPWGKGFLCYRLAILIRYLSFLFLGNRCTDAKCWFLWARMALPIKSLISLSQTWTLGQWRDHFG